MGREDRIFLPILFPLQPNTTLIDSQLSETTNEGSYMNIQNLLSVKQVCASLNLSRSWLFLAEREGRYPKGVRLTPRCVRYRADLQDRKSVV